jgi:hypothetical protein
MRKYVVLIALLSFASSLAFADEQTFLINFEQYPEFTQITNQYTDDLATFTNSLELVAPDYDYFDYPPHSGSGVITNDPNDPIEVDFSEPISTVTGWVSAPDGATLTLWGTGGEIGSYILPDTNMSNEEFLEISSIPITEITLSATDGADSETLDDLGYITTPEPGSLTLLGSGVLVMAGALRRKLKR